MQYDVKTPEEYFAMLEDDWRKERLATIRDMVFRHAPKLEESILYKMLSYGIGENYVFALNAQKHYVSFYVGDIDKIAKSQTWLDGFSLGKGCIRISKKKTDLSGLEQFIIEALKIWQVGGDVSC